jgi:ribosomal protein L44E
VAKTWPFVYEICKERLRMRKESVDTLVGKDVEAYCGKCKSDTWHVVTVIKNGKVAKVICKICNATHAYKAPEKEETKVKAAATTTRRRAIGTKRVSGRGKKDWGTLVGQIEDKQVADYAISGEFSTSPAIRHKNFGVGVITKVLAKNKIEVLFQEGTKILAQNLEMV